MEEKEIYCIAREDVPYQRSELITRNLWDRMPEQQTQLEDARKFSPIRV